MAIIAVQGPHAREKVWQAVPEMRGVTELLKPFQSADCAPYFVGRTGYTGEDGFEIILPANQAEKFWQALSGVGVKPIGLGARDTLRLEAGMNLYGQDMDETVTPLESGLAWTVDLIAERDFIGKAVLKEQVVTRDLFGLVLIDKACCAAIKRCAPPMATAKSPAAVSRPPSTNRSRWRVCPKRFPWVSWCRWKCATNCSRRRW